MEKQEKIPIVVGVTGHRNIVEKDKPFIKAQVLKSLKDIQELCRGKDNTEDTPIVMLNAFAQGADMLCAEAAFEVGIDVYAVLPCPKEKYIRSFDNETDKNKLYDYLEKTKRQIIAPDIEKNKAWLKKNIDISDTSYEYRQLGIYMAEHSHILIALWDGKPPSTQFGCGTVEVIKFALEHKFLDEDHLFKPGTINDSAVIWIKSRREGDGTEADIQKKWLISNLASCKAQENEEYIVSDNPPEFITEIILKTKEYNNEIVSVSDGRIKLWKDVDELDEYRKSLRYHYIKADELSYRRNQKPYTILLLILAILGTIVASTFLIYDEAALPFMIFPCIAVIGIIVLVCFLGERKGFHKKYIKYRAFAEALRIQFYLSMCLKEREIITNVCDLYSWTQKVDMIWTDKAIQALSVINTTEKAKTDTNKVIDIWIGRNKKPTGQLSYHIEKRPINLKKAKKYEKLSKIFRDTTLLLYAVIFVIEIVACFLKYFEIDWFWEGYIFAKLPWRNFGAIILGGSTVGSLLLSGYWGKLSFNRKAEDNEKMIRFYASANERWNEAKSMPYADIEKFLKEIAREEIVENGIWCSYVNENHLDMNI